MIPTTFVLGIGGICVIVGAGIAYGVLRTQTNQALAWCKQLQGELKKVSDQCNWNTRKIERFSGRMEGGSSRRFRSDETSEWKKP